MTPRTLILVLILGLAAVPGLPVAAQIAADEVAADQTVADRSHRPVPQPVLPQPVRDPAAGGPVLRVGPAAGDLGRALAGTTGGETLLLPGGDYGALWLRPADVPGAAPGRPVTLRSADPADPARFSGLMLRDMAHLRFEDVVFAYRPEPGDKPDIRPFQINGGRDIALRRVRFLDQSPPRDDRQGGRGFGLALRGSQGIEIADSVFAGWIRGLVVGASRDLVIRGNDLSGMRSDGMDFAGVQRVLIEANFIHDFNRAPDARDHADMIQFWTAGTDRATTDVTIRGNVLMAAGGLFTQSIFMRNELVDSRGAGPGMYYRAVAIENNIIINAHLHGITVGAADGLTIRGNTLAVQRAAAGKDAGSALWVPQIRVVARARNVVIAGNITPAITNPHKAGSGKEGPGKNGSGGGGSGWPGDWQVTGNLLTQDRSRADPGHVETVFVAPLTGERTVLAAFAYLPGGPADPTGHRAADEADATGGVAQGVPDAAADGAADGAAGGAPDGPGPGAQTVPGAPGLALHPAPVAAVALIRVGRDPAAINRFTFDASLSRGAAGAAVTGFSWDFGDTGAPGSAAEPGPAGAPAGTAAPAPAQGTPAFDTAAPDTAAPATAAPGIIESGIMESGMAQSGMAQSGMAASGMMESGMAGPVATYSFATPGSKVVTVTLHFADGTSAQGRARIAVPGTRLLGFDAATGTLSSWSMGVARPRPEPRARRLPDGRFVLLTGRGGAADGKVLTLPPGATAGFFGARDFELRLTLRANSSTPAGELLRIHPGLIVTLGQKGEIGLRLATDGREVRLGTGPQRLYDGNWHEIALRYSAAPESGIAPESDTAPESGTAAAPGLVEIALDGTVQAQGRGGGAMLPPGRAGLAFGNPFGRKSFDGEIAGLGFSANTLALAPADGPAPDAAD